MAAWPTPDGDPSAEPAAHAAASAGSRFQAEHPGTLTPDSANALAVALLRAPLP